LGLESISYFVHSSEILVPGTERLLLVRFSLLKVTILIQVAVFTNFPKIVVNASYRRQIQQLVVALLKVSQSCPFKFFWVFLL
ncbi:MAG: hypothetical protein ACK56F_07660, partial [bacterium]